VIAAALAALCLSGTIHERYAAGDSAGLRTLLATAPSRADSLEVRYRLYALTRDRTVIARLPDDLSDGRPRELALLSALWAWHIPGSAPWNVVRYGRRSKALLDRALAGAPTDPLVWLIDAQSLIFRPGIAGGDVHRAADRLRELRDRLTDAGTCGVNPVEVDYWLWYALSRAGDPAAGPLRERLLASRLPPLYQRMLDADNLAAGD